MIDVDELFVTVGWGWGITILLDASTWEAAGRINHNSVHSDGQ